MNSRMEKYTGGTTSIKQRAKRNEKLYDEVLDMSIDYVNIDVDNALELNPSPNVKSSREDYQKQRELNKLIPKESNKKAYPDIEEKKDDTKIYDINEILKLARENKLFEDSEKKRLINTEYNILTKLDVKDLESEEMKKEDLKSLINGIYEKEKPKKIKKYSRKKEEELLNDLFDEYDPEQDLEEELRLKEELSKEILDKNKEEQPIENKESEQEEPVSDVTNIGDIIDARRKQEETSSITEKIKDIPEIKEEKIIKEEVQDSDDDFIEEPEGKGLFVAIIIVIILIILTGLFFAYEYFFGL